MSREERGGEEGSVLMGGCMSHTHTPRGEGRVWGSSNPPPQLPAPPEKGEWMLVSVLAVTKP